MYCLVIGGNYLAVTARPSERGGEKERKKRDEGDERKAGKEWKEYKSMCDKSEYVLIQTVSVVALGLLVELISMF